MSVVIPLVTLLCCEKKNSINSDVGGAIWRAAQARKLSKASRSILATANYTVISKEMLVLQQVSGCASWTQRTQFSSVSLSQSYLWWMRNAMLKGSIFTVLLNGRMHE